MIGRERRELRFAEPPEAMRRAIEKRKEFLKMAYGEAQEKAEKVAGNVPVENLRDGVDEKRQVRVNQISETLFFDDEAPTPELEEAKVIAQGLLLKYQDYIAGDDEAAYRLKGLRFGVKAIRQSDGKLSYGLRVFGADIAFIQFALADVTSKMKFLKEPPEAKVMVARRKNEGEEAYLERSKRQQEMHRQFLDQSGSYASGRAAALAYVLEALTEGEKETTKLQAITSGNRSLDSLTPEEKRENAPAYKKLLVDQSEKDPRVLAGREADFSDPVEFVRDVVIPASVKNPQALRYFPESLKKSDVEVEVTEKGVTKKVKPSELYLQAMTDAVVRDGTLLQAAIDEYDKYWKDKERFDTLLVQAINAKPAMFFRERGKKHWREVGTNEKASVFSAVLRKLDQKTKIEIAKLLNAATIGELDDFDTAMGRGYLGFVYDLLQSTTAMDKDALRVVARNEYLFRLIKKSDEDLYHRMLVVLGDLKDPDIVQLLQNEHVHEDEDLAKAIITSFLEAMYKEKVKVKITVDGKEQEVEQYPDTDNDGRPDIDETKVEGTIRKYRDRLSDIPAYVFAEENVQKKILELFRIRGELFEYAPAQWKEDKDIALLVVMQNANAYPFINASLRADRANGAELLYAAMVAEQAGRGNMHWKDVPDYLKETLAYLGDMEGIPSTDRLLKFILGVKYDEALNADMVHSLMDLWSPELKKNKEFTQRYLYKHLQDPYDAQSFRPQYFLDAAPEFRSDIGFVGQMMNGERNERLDNMRGNPAIFKHLGTIDMVKIVYNGGRTEIRPMRSGETIGSIFKMDGVDTKQTMPLGPKDVHEYFYEKDKAKYMQLVIIAVRSDPEMLQAIPESLRYDAAFLTEVYLATGNIEIFKQVPEEKLRNPDFVISVVAELVKHSANASHIVRFFRFLPREPWLLNSLLSHDDGKLLSILISDPELTVSYPPEAYTAEILSTVISRVMETRAFIVRGWNWPYVIKLLRVVPSAVRLEYLGDPRNREFTQDMVREDIETIRLLPDTLLTVEFLQSMIDDINMNALVRLLIEYKPMVLVGLIRTDFELWKRLDTATQKLLMAKLDLETITGLSGELDLLDEEKEVADYTERLDYLRRIRQQIRYYETVVGNTQKFYWPDWSKADKADPKKRMTIAQFIAYLDGTDTGPTRKENYQKLLTELAADRKKVSGERIQQEVDIHVKALNMIREQLDITKTDVAKFSAPMADLSDLDATGILPNPTDSARNGLGMEKAHMRKAATSRLNLMQVLMESNAWRLDAGPRKQSAEDQEKARKFLDALRNRYKDGFESRATELTNITEMLKLDPSNPLHKAKIDERIEDINDLLDTFKSDEAVPGAAVRRGMKLAVLTAMEDKLREARENLKALRRMNGRLHASLQGTQEYYDLHPTAVAFADKLESVFGVSRYDVAKAMTAELTGHPVDIAKYAREYTRLMSNDEWLRANQMAVELGINFRNLSESQLLGALNDVMMLAQEQHSYSLIRFLKTEVGAGKKLQTLGYAGKPDVADFGPATLRTYRSMIIMVSREMGGGFTPDRAATMWKEIRDRQIKAASESPDVGKQTDVFAIVEDDGPDGYISKTAEGQTELVQRALNGRDPVKQGTLAGFHKVKNREQFMAQMNVFQELQARYATEGKSLVLIVRAHGRGKSGNALEVDVDTIASMMNPQTSTLLYTSCSDGKHLMSVARTSPGSMRVNVFTDAFGTVRPIDSEQTMFHLLEQAMKAPDADINGDKKVSIPEAYFWMDRHMDYQDMTGTNPDGKQIVRNRSSRDAKLA